MQFKNGTTFTAAGIHYQVVSFNIANQTVRLQVTEAGKQPYETTLPRQNVELLAGEQITFEQAQTRPVDKPEAGQGVKRVKVAKNLRFRMGDQSAWTVTDVTGQEVIITEYFRHTTQQMPTAQLQELLDNQMVKVVEVF